MPRPSPCAPGHDSASKSSHHHVSLSIRYPSLAVAELFEPNATTNTSGWDFHLIDPITEAFMEAMDGRPVVMNFATIPQVRGSEGLRTVRLGASLAGAAWQPLDSRRSYSWIEGSSSCADSCLWRAALSSRDSCRGMGRAV
jgi:hypothetical protein